MKRSLLGWLCVLICLASPSGVSAGYSNVFIFGDSLSDSGNNAVVLAPNVTPVPISGNSFIPTFPYASGHYTNGQVWAQSLASSLGLSANPSLLGGTDYAFGGARTGPLTPNALPSGLLNPFPPSLETQVAFFLLQYANVAPSNALYVVAGGGNNARDALVGAAGCGGNFACINGIIQSTAAAFAKDIGTIDAELELAGARKIVVWDVPDIGLTPAVRAAGASASALGTLIAASMNAALLGALDSDPQLQLFDLFGLQDRIVTNPGAFGLTDVANACAQFSACNPSQFLFWDGIHPTSAGALIISNAVLAQIPEPATLVLLGVGLDGLTGIAWRRHRRTWSLGGRRKLPHTENSGLGACRRNANCERSASRPSHFGAFLACVASASALRMCCLWGSHPTFQSRHDFADRFLGWGEGHEGATTAHAQRAPLGAGRRWGHFFPLEAYKKE